MKINADKFMDDNNDDNIFKIEDKKENIYDASFYSLKIALKAYYATYHSVKDSLDNIDCTEKISIDARVIKAVNNTNEELEEDCSEYIENYMNIAIHLQHFFELEIKKLLENTQKMLSLNIKNDPILLYKILANGTELNETDYSKCKTVEFMEALTRLKKLNKEGIITDELANLFCDNECELRLINNMRNMALHKGIKIIKYCALDELMTQNILPIIRDILAIKRYEYYKEMFNSIDGINVIEQLIQAGKRNPIDYGEIALFKEFGRTSGLKRLTDHKYHDKQELIYDEIEKYYKIFSGTPIENAKVKCPCCKNNSLINIFDVVDSYYEDEMPTLVHGYTRIKCVACNFSINRFIKTNEYSNLKIPIQWEEGIIEL